MDYDIHKGTGKTVEFKGLKSQYLIIFFGGIFALFILFVILRVTGVPLIVNLVFILGGGGSLVYFVFYYNKKYGRYGLMKQGAKSRHPRFVVRRKSFFVMLKL